MVGKQRRRRGEYERWSQENEVLETEEESKGEGGEGEGKSKGEEEQGEEGRASPVLEIPLRVP